MKYLVLVAVWIAIYFLYSIDNRLEILTLQNRSMESELILSCSK